MNIRDDLKAFIDGELDATRHAEVAQAIASDTELQSEVEAMRILGLEIQRVGLNAQPVGLEQALSAIGPRKMRWPLRLGLAIPVILVTTLALNNMARRPVGDSAEAMAEPAMMKGKALSDYSGGGFTSGAADADRAKEESPAFATPPSDGVDKFRDTEAKSLAQTHRAGEANARAVIRSATMELRVENVATAQDDAEKFVERLGGFVADSSAMGANSALPTATLTLRVPEQSFNATLDHLRKLGDFVSGSTSGDDVTAEIADTEARLKVMRAEEESYITMLRAARKVGELLEVKERLSQVRQQIESLAAQNKSLKDLARLSTITVTFVQRPGKGEPEAPKNWAEDTWSSAVDSLRGVGRFLGQAIITVFIFAPVWLPIVLVSWWILHRKR